MKILSKKEQILPATSLAICICDTQDFFYWRKQSRYLLVLKKNMVWEHLFLKLSGENGSLLPYFYWVKRMDRKIYLWCSLWNELQQDRSTVRDCSILVFIYFCYIYCCYQFTVCVLQIAFLVASLLGLRRVFFGGSYIRGHKSTMENISFAIDFW